MEEMHTFVLEKVAHPRPARKHQLSHILDNLGLFLGRESSKPLGQTLQKRLSLASYSSIQRFYPWGGGPRDVPLCLVATAGSDICTGSAFKNTCIQRTAGFFSLDSHNDCW